MANEKNNEKVNENVEKATVNETNVKNDANNDTFSREFDVFESRRNRDENLEFHSEDDAVVFKTNRLVQRIKGGSSEDGQRIYYNYATGYRNVINGKEVALSIPLVPVEKRAEMFDLLDAIFGEAESVTLYILRTSRTNTVNGFSRTVYTYTPQVRATDEDGVEFFCSLSPSGRAAITSFSNLINKLKSKKIIE